MLIQNDALGTELVFLERYSRVRFAGSNHARHGDHLEPAFFIDRGGPRDRKFDSFPYRELRGGLKQNTLAAHVYGLPGLLGGMAAGIEQAVA
jgi:hypothetical protein